MPETTGVVTGFIQNRDGAVFGLKVSGEEYLYSVEDYRGTPFQNDRVSVGNSVRIEWAPFTNKQGKEKKYANVLEVLDSAEPDPFEEEPEPSQAAPEGQRWGFEQKDRLQLKESCIKAASLMFAARSEALKVDMPTIEQFGDYWRAVERLALRTLQEDWTEFK